MNNTDIRTQVGARIKECRKAQGITQEQLAEMLFTSKVTISNYENGKVELGVTVLKELAEVLGTTVAYLADGVVEAVEAPDIRDNEKEALELFRRLEEVGLEASAISQMEILLKASSILINSNQ